MTLAEAQKSLAMLHEFLEILAQFETGLQRLWAGKQYTGTEWMAGPTAHTPMSELDFRGLEQLEPFRTNVAKHVDEVTEVLSHYELPTVWTVHPPRLIGGLIRRYNMLDAFIDLEMDREARPSFLQVSDVLNKAVRRLERDIEGGALDNAPSKLAVIPPVVKGSLNWLFPGEKQRAALGWIIIAGLVLSILRFGLGIHLEQAGKILMKLFKVE